ncbi:hypothetical protein BleG1_3560 [Shouchella lehensis G1]|uniref:Uncharacterized protein n=1 Tax=Shouchella lehensis G1 TaxID=1246626 RepID=A0A060M127_9BACI|nr:hypothetical protein BleG1_3560 [Shouchella lehensis G1]
MTKFMKVMIIIVGIFIVFLLLTLIVASNPSVNQ